MDSQATLFEKLMTGSRRRDTGQAHSLGAEARGLEFPQEELIKVNDEGQSDCR